MLKIGHRGAKGHVAENTLASFQKAIDLGVDMIELDIQLSLDKVPMVIHDTTVERTTSSTGLVTDFSAKELQQLGIPTLAAVFELVNNRICAFNVVVQVLASMRYAYFLNYFTSN
jgi:glycerophosphoryl diester phosphodiesterase